MNILQKKSVVIPNPVSFWDNKDLETWVVNSVKVKMVTKMDNYLEREGRINLRKLFLVPIFSISELEKRVKETAPEMKTVFYKELSETIAGIEAT